MATQYNPLSIPGGWNKDTPKDTPANENKNPVDLERDNTAVDPSSIPRSATGVVNDAGEIIDQSGKSIGKIADSKDPQELVGKTVNATGDIVNSAGDVLGSALLNTDNSENNDEGEYTTENEKPQEKKGGGLLGTVGGVTKGLGSVTGRLGLIGGKQQQQQEQEQEPLESHNNTSDTLTSEKEQFQKEARPEDPEPLEDADKSTIQLEDKEQTADDVKDKASEAVDKNAPAESVQDKTEEAKDSAPAPGDKLDEAKEDVEQKKDEAPVPNEELDETKQGLDQKKDEVSVPSEEVDEAQKDVDQKTDEAAVPDEKVDEAKEGLEQKEAGVDETTEQLDEKKEEVAEEAPIDFSVLKGTKVNKAGNLVNNNGDVIGRIIEGELKHLIGKKVDEEGKIWNDSGKVIGKAEPIPDTEKEDYKDFRPFENFPNAIVEGDGKVTSDGQQVGVVVEGDPKKLKGSKVDEDGDILDRRGNVIGKAEAWDEPEAEPEAVKDQSMLAGKRVNKAGNVVNSSGEIFGRVVEGNAKAMVGRMCDKNGNILSESGDVIGRAELIPEGEREGLKEGPFADLSGLTVGKDGKVVTPSGDVVGRLIKGDAKLLAGRTVDEDGDVLDRNGNSIGKAERWEEPEVEKKKDPLAGRRVNREGNVVDEDGNIVGKLTSGDLGICTGKEIDDDGDVINSKGQSIGHVNLLSDIPEPEPEPEVESAEDKQKREQAEKDKELAGQLGAAVSQALDRVRPICKRIDDKINAAESKPKDELDEEQLVREVRPLIEDGNKILTETNGVIRGMDPDGRIQRNAKHKSATQNASAEEHQLAEVIKELTGTISETIDNGKRKLEGMPHAKKHLNPLWGLLTEPLGQIIAGVGLLLNGVLSLVGKLLNGLGLGGILDNLLGVVGLDKILDGLGLGDVTGALTGKKKK